MMRIIHISLLWIAGVLLLGHNIIPHHHHQSEQKVCAEEHHQHEHEHEHNNHHEHDNDNSYNAICCDTESENHEACNFDQRTTVKDYNGQFTSLVSTTIKLPHVFEQQCSLWYIFKIGIVSSPFWDSSPSRAPPLV